MKTVALAALAALAIGGGAFMIHMKMQPPPPEAPPDPDTSVFSNTHGGPSTHTVPVEDPPPELDAGVDAASDAASVAIVDPRHATFDAMTDVGIATQIRVSPETDAEYEVDQGPWLPVQSGGTITLDLEHDVDVHVRNTTGCCQQNDKVISPGKPDTIAMPFLPGRVTPTCALPVEVRVNGTVANLNKPFTVPFGQALSRTQTVKVEFLGEHVDHTPIPVTVVAHGDEVKVSCVPR